MLRNVSACINCQRFALALGYLRTQTGKKSCAKLLPCKREMTVCLTVSEIGGGKWHPVENKDTA